jgi:hypothetical protein
LLILFASVFVILLGGYLVLKNEALQQRIVSSVTQSLSAKIGSEVSLDGIEWNFPNRFVINDLYVEDEREDTLLFVDRAKVTVNLFQLFNRTVSLRTVQLTNMNAHISQDDSSKVYNFQFLLDAFRKEEPDSSSIKWAFDIETVAFTDCSLAFHRNSDTTRKECFDPSHVNLKSLDGSLYVRSFTEDSIHVKLHEINFEEASGLALSNLSTTIISNSEQLNFYNFVTEMPQSRVVLDEASFVYDDLSKLKANPLHNVKINLDFGRSVIGPGDLAFFVPQLAKLKDKVLIKGSIRGPVDNVSLSDFTFLYGKTLALEADMRLRGLPDMESLLIDASIERFSASFDDVRDVGGAFIGRELYFSPKLDSLGIISYRGYVNGSLTDASAVGEILTDAGNVYTDVHVVSDGLKYMQYKIDGKVKAWSFELDKLLGKKSQLGNTSFSLDVGLNKKADRDFSLFANGTVDSLEFRNYVYRNVKLNGTFVDEAFDGSLRMNDKNVQVDFKGSINLDKELPAFRFLASVQDAKLNELNLIKGDDKAALSFDVETNFSGRKLDDIEGSFSIDNVLFTKNDKELLVNNFSLAINKEKNGEKKLSLYSDYLNGSLTGSYLFTSVATSFQNLLHEYLPSICRRPENDLSGQKRNDFKFKFTIDNTEPIGDVVNMPFQLIEESSLTGFFNDSLNKFRVRFETPQMSLGKTNLADVTFLCENPDDVVKVVFRTTHLPSNRRRNPYFVSLKSNARRDSVDLNLHFSNSVEETYSGSLSLLAVMKGLSKDGLTADFFINPTKVILKDSVWSVHESKVTLAPNFLDVDKFVFECDGQQLRVDGTNSLSDKDSISVSLNSVQLGNISDILNNKSISFDGTADGNLSFFRLFKDPYVTGGLDIHETELNEAPLGDLELKAGWDKEDKSVMFGANLFSVHDRARSDIWGGVYLGNDSLFIAGDLHDVDLRFLRKYIGSILENNTGTASGQVRAYGKFGRIGLEGNPVVKDMAFDIGYLNTSYVLSDTVFMTPTSFRLNQSPVFDSEGNFALASGLVLHQGFRNFKFAVDLNTDKILALNTKEQDNETFYGKAYGKGKVKISGNQKEVNFKLRLSTMPNTKISIPMDNVSNASDADFITFVEPEERLTATEKRRRRREKLRTIRESKSSKTVMNLDMDIAATPDAQILLIMDPVQGDVIKATGAGDMRLAYNTKDNAFKMYGSYEIAKGEYLFTIQSVISRKFDISEGSVVRWTGSPYDAVLDIKAKYFLNASLTEIIDDPSYKVASAQVNCLLGLTGTLSRPDIKFDIDLPNSDEEIKRKLKSIINTEESMNKNVASLLALGHFYTMDKNGTNGSNELSSVGFSTLSSQISSMLSRINNDVNVGVNYRPASNEDVTASSEFEVALSTQLLNDRLQVYGNFGYRDNAQSVNSENLSNSIVDFDVEYKLSRAGKFRVKAFNRTNNSYFKQSAQTQGVGLIYREDFDSFGQLFKGYFNPVRNIFRKSDAKKPEEDSVVAPADSLKLKTNPNP